jgi:hypothetical protein
MKVETFFEFCNQLNRPFKVNEKGQYFKEEMTNILYKGKKMYRYVAFVKFGSYNNLIKDKNISLTVSEI